MPVLGHCTLCGQTLVEFLFCSGCAGQGEDDGETCRDCGGPGYFALEADCEDICPECRASQYGKVDAHAQPKLFEPAPTQMAGQTAMEGME